MDQVGIFLQDGFVRVEKIFHLWYVAGCVHMTLGLAWREVFCGSWSSKRVVLENLVTTCLQRTRSRSATSKLRSIKVLCLKTPAETQLVGEEV